MTIKEKGTFSCAFVLDYSFWTCFLSSCLPFCTAFCTGSQVCARNAPKTIPTIIPKIKLSFILPPRFEALCFSIVFVVFIILLEKLKEIL